MSCTLSFRELISTLTSGFGAGGLPRVAKASRVLCADTLLSSRAILRGRRFRDRGSDEGMADCGNGTPPSADSWRDAGVALRSVWRGSRLLLAGELSEGFACLAIFGAHVVLEREV